MPRSVLGLHLPAPPRSKTGPRSTARHEHGADRYRRRAHRQHGGGWPDPIRQLELGRLLYLNLATMTTTGAATVRTMLTVGSDATVWGGLTVTAGGLTVTRAAWR